MKTIKTTVTSWFISSVDNKYHYTNLFFFIMKEYWIARDRFGTLLLFNNKPKFDGDKWVNTNFTFPSPRILPDDIFPDLDYKSSPKKIGYTE